MALWAFRNGTQWKPHPGRASRALHHEEIRHAPRLTETSLAGKVYGPWVPPEWGSAFTRTAFSVQQDFRARASCCEAGARSLWLGGPCLARKGKMPTQPTADCRQTTSPRHAENRLD